MKNTPKPTGFSSLLNHAFEGEDPSLSHAAPIYQSSAFRFDSSEGAAAAFAGEESAYIYTRLDNPNHTMVVKKIAAMEGWDLLGDRPFNEITQVVDGQLYASGMAAISSAIYCRVNQGDTIICQQNVYGATNQFLKQLAVKLSLKLVWVQGEDLTAWQQAFLENPQAKLAYAETPANPTLSIVDLQAVADLAHRYQAWLLVDNTFASPFNQRPFNQGADVIIHSTTKYLSGHGVIIGGIVLSRHPEWVTEVLNRMPNCLAQHLPRLMPG